MYKFSKWNNEAWQMHMCLYRKPFPKYKTRHMLANTYPSLLPITVLIFSHYRECLHTLELYKQSSITYMLRYKDSFSNVLRIILVVVYVHILFLFIVEYYSFLTKTSQAQYRLSYPWGHLCCFHFGAVCIKIERFCMSFCEGTFHGFLFKSLEVNCCIMGLNVWLDAWFIRNCQKVSRMVAWLYHQQPAVGQHPHQHFMVSYLPFGHFNGCAFILHFPEK
jgi:hypothetical protein